MNFGITVAEIQPKVWERRRKRWREKMLNFGNGDTKFPVPNSAAQVYVKCPKWKEKKNWQTNCGNGITENGGEKKKRGSEINGRVKKKKKGVMSTICLQHLHNKSHVISYY